MEANRYQSVTPQDWKKFCTGVAEI